MPNLFTFPLSPLLPPLRHGEAFPLARITNLNQDSSTNPLLFDDPTTNYGSVGIPDNTPPSSTVADQRNDKELENIVHLASQKLIPIYDSPDSQAGVVSPYRNLVNKLSEETLGDGEGTFGMEGAEVEDEWGSDGESDDGNEAVSYADALKGRPDIGPCTTTLKRAEEGEK